LFGCIIETMNQDQFSEILKTTYKRQIPQSEILEEKDCGKYIRQKIEFFVDENDRIPAYILIPKNLKKKTAAIYCHHQHASDRDIGKSEVVGLAGDSNMAYAKELAEQGFITFAPDCIAFEERQNEMGGGEGNYFELAKRLIKDENLLAKALEDISLGIDYLEAREEVDSDEIGFIGHSYGGRMAIFAPAYDKRIKVSVSNCGCVNYKDSINKKIGIQLEFCVPGFTNFGDVEDVVRLAAPCPLLISATSNDKYSFGANEMFEYAKESFNDGDLELKIYEGDHIFNEEMRDYAYSFLSKYLSK